MLQAANLPSLDAALSPINARPMAATTQTAVDVQAPLAPTYVDLGVSAYMYRDQELLSRDLTVASYVAQMTLQAAAIWNTVVDDLILPVVPPNILQYQLSDTGGTAPSTPAHVRHVQNSGVPADAVRADQNLYSRDAVVYQALAIMSLTFAPVERLIPNTEGNIGLDNNIDVDNNWSRAKADSNFAEVSVSDWYGRSVFFHPDQYLAYRDNAVAYHAANLNLFLTNIFAQADRLWVRIDAASGPPLAPAPVVSDGSATVTETYPFFYQVNATNYPTEYTLDLTDGNPLPYGLTLDPVTGSITGTVAVGYEGMYVIIVDASNPSGMGSGTITLNVVIPPVVECSDCSFIHGF